MADYMRQMSIFDPSQFDHVRVTIAGLGNIGSHTALALARMGLKKFTLYDHDVIEEHNLASQAYGYPDLGRSKVSAIVDQMKALNPEIEIEAHEQPFTGAEQRGHILISAVDSIDIRRAICAQLPVNTFVIDGRMGGGQIEVHSQVASEWAATLPAEADTDPCGARYISYTSYIIAGLIANNVKRHLLNQRLATRILLHVDTLESIVTREPLPEAVAA